MQFCSEDSHILIYVPSVFLQSELFAILHFTVYYHCFEGEVENMNNAYKARKYVYQMRSLCTFYSAKNYAEDKAEE